MGYKILNGLASGCCCDFISPHLPHLVQTQQSPLIFGISSIFLSSHLCSLNGMLFVQTVVSFSSLLRRAS